MLNWGKRAAIAALTLAVSSTVVSPAHAETDFKAMIEAHNTKFDHWDQLLGKENAAILFTGTRQKTVTHYVFGCPSGTWTFKGATNFDAADNGGVGFADRLQAKVAENREACLESRKAIVAAAEKESWSPAMEVLEDGPDVLVGMEQSTENKQYTRVAPELVAQKRNAFVDSLATAVWSAEVERKAATVRPYAGAAAVDKALMESRKLALSKLAADKSVWSPQWVARFDEIKKVLPVETNAVIDARFKQLVDSFANDGKPWSLAWEQSVKTATAGATNAQMKLVAEVVGKRRQAAAQAFATDGKPWSLAWEATLSDLAKADKALADKVIADRRAAAVKAFQNDGKPWTPEWDKSIAPLASVSADAQKLRADRRAAYVREVTANRGWNEVSDRIFQGFLEDSAARRVVLDGSTVTLIDTWRARAVEGLSANREWSPELEAEYSYLTVTYPKAKTEMEKLREAAANKALADIKAKGWNAQADAKLAQVAEYQYTPYGQILDDTRKQALADLKAAKWSPENDQKLQQLGKVYPLAKDAAAQERQEAFSAIVLPKQWNEKVDGQLEPLAEAGYTPAAQALETLRSEQLARLEMAEATPERDIALAKLAEVYAPAREVMDSGTLAPVAPTTTAPATTAPATTKPVAPATSTPATATEAPTSTPVDGEPVVDGEEDASSQSSNADGEEGSSAADAKEIIAIIMAVITALGAVAGVVGPLASQFGMAAPRF